MVSCFREFLTGFHKRKLQRKKEAREKFERELKEERKRLKAEAKNSYKKLVVSARNIPELETLLKDEYQDDEATVRIEELCTADIAKESNWVGENKASFVAPEQTSEEEDDDEEVPGMEIKPKKRNFVQPNHKFETEKDVKKLLKKEATKKVQKSKVFQMKNKLETQKQRKKSNQMKKQRIKIKENKSRKRK